MNDLPAPRYSSPDWFSRHIPNWVKWLAPLMGRPGARMLEIGSYEGRSARWLLENVMTGKDATLICVDPHSEESLAASSIELPERSTAHKNFVHNMAPFAPRVRHFRGRSMEAFPSLWKSDGECVDAVYIDGSHLACDVLTDAVLAWSVTKKDSILIFDDYEWNQPNEPVWRKPRAAIDAFLSAFREHYEFLHKGVQVAIRRTTHP